MDALKKINWKQPKYMIPIIIYFPLLFVGYFVIDLFHTEKAETPNGLTTTDYLNPELPDANMKGDGIGNKYDNMLKSYGKIDDYTALGNIDRNEEDKKKSMIQNIQKKSLNNWNLRNRKPRNSLRCKDNYRRAHRKVRKSHKATVLLKKTA